MTDTIFIIIVGLSGFIMGAAACRDMEIVIDHHKQKISDERRP